MSRNQRIGLIVAAIVIAVVAFLVASPSSDESADDPPATTSAQPEGETDTSAEAPPEESTTEVEELAPPPEPEVTRIRIQGGEVEGGAQDITVQAGDRVRIVVTSDAPDEIHLHGYDVTESAAPGSPARFNLRANLEGAFEIESHVAEDAGRDPLVARLNVEPG
jgi:FtsP/CotA-like multicopper oxidase with cupredoxin domain